MSLRAVACLSAVSFVAACGGGGVAAAPPATPPVCVEAPPPPRIAEYRPSFILDKTVPGVPSSFRLHASEHANLFYQLDCLSGAVRCSRAAYEDLWKTKLQGLDDGDVAALERWKTTRARYHGRVEKDGESVDVGLPVPRPRRQIESRQRLAGYLAGDAQELGAALSLFLDPPDVDATVSTYKRFLPRFHGYWLGRQHGLSASIAAYAKLFARDDVMQAMFDAAQFYRPELPKGFTMDMELVARPQHDSPTSAELLGLRGLIEVMDDEAPEERFPVIAHEIFHAWLALAPYPSLASLTRRFAASDDREAIAGLGLLDEALATMQGNGRVARVVQPPEFERRLAKPRGFYDDPYIDGVAKALLASVDAHAPGSASVQDEGFFAMYMAAVHTAFPNGLPPIGHLRPFACLYDKSLRAGYERLVDVSHAGQIVSNDELDAKSARELLEGRQSWPLVVLLPAAQLDATLRASGEIDKATATKITQQARTAKSFVLKAKRASHAEMFVFVAENADALRKLVDAFAARTTTFDVLLLPEKAVAGSSAATK